MIPRIVTGCILVAALAVMAWLGRPAHLDSVDVELQTATVDSSIAEGVWLADIVARGDGFEPATITQSRALATSLDESARMLRSGRVPRSDAA